MLSRVTDLSTSIGHTTTGQHNQLKICVMRGTQASPKCNLGVCIFWDISTLVHHFCFIIMFIMDPVGPMMWCNLKTQVPPLCAAMQCGSLPGSQGLSVLNQDTKQKRPRRVSRATSF